MMIDAKALLELLEHVPLLGFKQIAKDDLMLDDLALDRQPNHAHEGPRKAPAAYLKYVRAEAAKVCRVASHSTMSPDLRPAIFSPIIIFFQILHWKKNNGIDCGRRVNQVSSRSRLTHSYVVFQIVDSLRSDGRRLTAR